MDKQVKAAVVTGPGSIEIRYFPYPDVKKLGGAVMRSIQSGICGTDKHTFKGETKQNSGGAAEYDVPYPLIQGHEAVGILEEIAPGYFEKDYYGEPLQVGDRITFCPDIVCGECYFCRHSSWYPWCDDPSRECYGNSLGCDQAPHLFGAFAEYMYLLPKSYIYKVPDALSDDLATLTELMCVTYSLDKAKELFAFDGEGFEFGGSVVVQGCGPVGLAHVIKARMMSAGKIIATDISDYKLNLAKAFGADICLNVLKTTPEERIAIVKEATHGLGANVVCECSGVPSVVPEGLEMIRKCGVYLEIGHFVEVGGVEVNMHKICAKNIRVIGMNNHAATGYRPTMEMMLRHEKDFPWDQFISHKFKLDEYDTAIRTSMTPESMKVVVQAR
ncbi:MAG: zinc-binding dehydrogenase [Christensenellales bacterium]|jgi:threonine dehydrogenase-like Zn-dependent dehydrogenase